MRHSSRLGFTKTTLLGLVVIGLATPGAAAGSAARSADAGGGPPVAQRADGTAGIGPDLDGAVRPNVVGGVDASAFNPASVAIDLEPIASGLYHPLRVVNAGDGSGRLFVVEQRGMIKVIDGGDVLPTPFLNLEGAVLENSEAGMLGLAFHPSFPTRPWRQRACSASF